MTPTQQRLADLWQKGREIQSRASMVEMHEWLLEINQAELDAWQAGECCGDKRADGSCKGRLVCAMRGNDKCDRSGT